MNKGIIIVVIVIIIGAVWYTMTGTASALTFGTLNLDTLESGHYEGWAIFGEEKVSIGTFMEGSDDLTLSSRRDLSSADMIVITIEPEGDTDEVPSGIAVLSGSVEEDGSVALSFPLDFTNASGNYILATPTDGSFTHENSGVWFLKLPEPLQAGLSLPALPEGWVYEGWVVNNDTPITTGRFTNVAAIDGFDGYSGSLPGPAFPGEDFLVNAPEGLTFPIDLGDGSSKVVISIEPDLEGEDPTGDGPFQAKPLIADVPAGAVDHFNYAMNLHLESLPSGSASVN